MRWIIPLVALVLLLLPAQVGALSLLHDPPPTYQTADGRVVQTFDLTGDLGIQLNFRFCDGATCSGPDDPLRDCHSNHWIPQFVGSLPQSFAVSAPKGSQPEKIFVKAGPVIPDQFGHIDYARGINDWNRNIFAEAPKVGTDGRLSFQFRQLVPEIADLIRPEGVCGIGEEAYQAFRRANPDAITNPLANTRITVVWSQPAPDGYPIIGQAIDLDGRSRTTGQAGQPTPDPVTPTPFSQRDRDWANQAYGNTTLGERGGVPTLLAAVLQGHGIETDPGQVATELTQLGAVDAQGQTSWSGIKSLLSRHNLTGHDTTARGAVQTLNASQPVLTAVTIDGAEHVILLTEYRSGRDQFRTLDPRTGKRHTMTWNQLMEGQPWFLAVQPNQS